MLLLNVPFYFLSNLLLSVSLSLFTPDPELFLFNLLTYLIGVFMFPPHFASVYKGDFLMCILKPEVLSLITMTGPSSELHDFFSIDRLAHVVGSPAAPMILIGPFLS